MTGLDFYTFLRNWCVAALNDNAIPVIRANQNAAKPAGTYVVVEDDVEWSPFGREDLLVGATESGVKTDYEVAVAIWEVSNGAGYGDTLRKIRDSLGLKNIKAMFSAARVGVLQTGDIMSLPWTSPETQVIREKRFEIRLSVANFTADTGGTPGTIVSVQTIDDLKVLQ